MVQFGPNAVAAAVRRLLETVTSPEGRLALTLAIAVVAVVAAAVAVPTLVRSVLGIGRRRVRNRPTVERIDAAAEGIPWEVIVRAGVRGLQAGVLFLAGLGVLMVWGFFGLATDLAAVVAGATPLGGRVVLSLALVVAAVVATNLIEEQLSEYAADSGHLNQHQEGIVRRVLQVTVFVAALVGVLGVWQVNPTGLLVGAGFLGIVVGMAARQTLGSVIAGFVLMFARPMELGDWVEIDGHEGIVTDITIVNTRIRSFGGEEIVLPNERVSNAAVVNRTARDHLRLSLEVGVDYDADLERAEELAAEAVESVDAVEPTPAPDVIPVSFGDSAVGIRLRYWISPPSAPAKWRTHAAVVRAVKARFDAAGIKIPYPQRELSGRAETGGFRVAGAMDGSDLPRAESGHPSEDG